MDKSFFLELTNDLYRLTLFFPKEEPLRSKIRELGDEVLADLISILEEEKEKALSLERSLKIIESLLELSKKQEWVKESEIDEVLEQYRAIRQEVESFNSESKKSKLGEEDKKEKPKKSISLNDRQKKIVNLLKEKEAVQVADVERVLKSVTKRTIRRDFDKLLKEGIVKRVGKGGDTSYRLIGQDRTE